MGWGRGGDSDGAAALKLMNLLRKVNNHPHLVLPGVSAPQDVDDEAIRSILQSSSAQDEEDDKATEGTSKAPAKKSTGGGASSAVPVDAGLSGKLTVALQLLRAIHQQSTDRVVVISTFTTTLDMLEALAKQAGWVYTRYGQLQASRDPPPPPLVHEGRRERLMYSDVVVRLDGSVSVSNRSGLVDAFNRPSASSAVRDAADPFLFLLSSRAGGVGLHLVGANRLILFDRYRLYLPPHSAGETLYTYTLLFYCAGSDWNPSVDRCVCLWYSRRPHRSSTTNTSVVLALSAQPVQESGVARRPAEGRLHLPVSHTRAASIQGR